MEIPGVCRLSECESSLNCLNSSSGIEVIANAQSLWAWGALVLAVVAALSSVANRVIRVSTFRRPQIRNSSISDPLLRSFDEDDDFSTSDEEEEEEEENDYETSSFSTFDDEEEEPSPSLRHRQESVDDEDFRVAGSATAKDQGQSRNFTFSWPDFAAGKSVVKLWDSGSSAPARSQIPAASPALIVAAAAADEARKIAFSVWDRRIGRRSPAIYAEWRPQQRAAAASVDCGGAGDVYVGDECSGTVTVGDLRKVRSPLGKMTESNGGDTWFDGDAAAECCDSVVARCRDVVGFYLL